MDKAADKIIKEFPNGGTVYRDGATAIAEHPDAKDNPALVIRGYWCNAYAGFDEERVYLYEVSPTGNNLIVWGELSGFCNSINRRNSSIASPALP